MSDISTKISRRGLIKSLAGIGLLSTTAAERLLAQTPTAPYRVLLVALQHGWGIGGSSNQFMSGEEYDYAFPPGLDPFNSIRDKCVVIDGLLTLGNWGNNHDLSYGDMFTAGVPMGEESSAFESHMPLSRTPSLDFLLQEKSKKTTLRLSAGYASWGVKYHPISIDGSGSVQPFYTSAFDAYNSVFKNLPDAPAGGGGNPSNDVEAQLVNTIFSTIRNPAQRQLDGLATSEQEKIRRYLQAIVSVEDKRKPVVAYSGGYKLSEIPERQNNRLIDLKQYLDMIKVAFANDLTTSAVLGIGDIHPISQFHHDHAHNNTGTWWNTRVEFAQAMRDFALSLDAITDVDGRSLLDNTLIVLSGEVGDGLHDVLCKGFILIGGGSRIETGRLIRPPVITGIANIDKLMREDAKGVPKPQIMWGNKHAMRVGSRTNADLLRDIGNIAGLSLTQFGLPSLNKGTILL
jgi:hypothetical protein